MVQTDFGGPEAAFPQDVPEPMCGPREVVVDVACCGLNRRDLLQLKGPGLIPGFCVPHVPGMDFAGTVVATGSAVSPVASGDRVIAEPAQGCGRCPVVVRDRRRTGVGLAAGAAAAIDRSAALRWHAGITPRPTRPTEPAAGR
ncbi:alcohol dehydrogenase catalytic domain-containing protein [Streptomyces sp. NPDC004609]|uniref:alcohol dehydrogenase catalytic domain-containing protein n=1 Tax=Streptomyces sp. NPDC004609 TaxID=3364704 RepID=UPI00369860D1